MGKDTGISWCDSTWNPVRGCSYATLEDGTVSRACLSPCYAEVLSQRNPAVLGTWGDEGARIMGAESYMRLPVKWNAEAERVIRKVFCASLADIWEGGHAAGRESRTGVRMDYLPMLARVWSTIRETPNLRWLLLSKRPWNAARYAEAFGWHPRAWAGCTAEGQREYEDRIDALGEIPAAIRFLSVEPMFEPVVLGARIALVQWVIIGGNSSPGSSALDLGAVRALIAECDAAGVAVFMKQLGWAHARRLGCATKGGSDPLRWPEDLRRQEFPVDVPG